MTYPPRVGGGGAPELGLATHRRGWRRSGNPLKLTAAGRHPSPSARSKTVRASDDAIRVLSRFADLPPLLRVVDVDGTHLGVFDAVEVWRRAGQVSCDVVLVDAAAIPPVVRLADAGKLRYDAAKAHRAHRHLPTIRSWKEIRLRPVTDDHDLAVKIRHARDFLTAGHPVRFTIRLRGREVTHPDIVTAMVDRVTAAIVDLADVSGVKAGERTRTFTARPRPVPPRPNTQTQHTEPMNRPGEQNR